MTGVSLPALSYKQPWCFVMLPTTPVPAEHWKSIENRVWGPTTVRGTTLMLASAGMTKPYYYAACEMAVACGFPREFVPPMHKLQLGGILGALEFVDVLPPGDRGQRWHFKDQFGIVLGKKCALPFRPYKGQQGFYQVEITRDEQELLKKAGML